MFNPGRIKDDLLNAKPGIHTRHFFRKKPQDMKLDLARTAGCHSNRMGMPIDLYTAQNDTAQTQIFAPKSFAQLRHHGFNRLRKGDGIAQWFAKTASDQPAMFGQFKTQMFWQAAIKLIKTLQNIRPQPGGDVRAR